MTISRVINFLKEGWTNFIGLLYPNLCVSCLEKSLGKDQLLCVLCSIEIPFTDHFENQENKVVEHFYGRIPIVHGSALLHFAKNSKVRNMLYNFKYEGMKEIGIMLGEALGRKLKESHFFSEIELIIPVPIHDDKRQRRGFNQSEIIAQGLLQICNIPYSPNVLVKLFDTETQTHKNRNQRMDNVQNTLGINNKEMIRGKNILLIDDVITTGATLEAAGKTLLENGAQSISVVVAGVTVNDFL